MGINTLMEQAFLGAPDFNAQVNGIVAEDAHFFNSKYIEAGAPMDDNTRNIINSLIDNPDIYRFAKAIVTDGGWATTFDAWATDPSGVNGAILAAVRKLWPLKTGLPTADTVAPVVEEPPA